MEPDQSVTKAATPKCDISVEECDDVNGFVVGILNDICDRITGEDELEVQNNAINLLKNERDRKEFNRKTFVFDDSSFSDDEDNLDENCNLTLKSKSAEIISTNQFDEEDEYGYEEGENGVVDAVNHLVVPKLVTSKSSDSIRNNLNVTPKHKEKKLSFGSFFRKKGKHKEHKDKTKMEQETYDDFDPFENLSTSPSRSLLKSRRYSSVSDISKASPPSLQRTPSFVKRKLASLQSETKTLIRSLSFRDLSKKKEKEKLAEMKNHEWKSSLQRLVENDTHVSYKDLSFVNYDELNTLSYVSAPKGGSIHRTQSMVEKVGYMAF